MRTLLLIPTIALLTACATAPQYTGTASFDSEEVSWFNEQGTNTIEGSAFVRQNNGGVVTCAGGRVDIFPAGRYASDRIAHLYGPGATGFNVRRGGNLPDADPEYLHTQKNVHCDVEGKFTVNDLPDGAYFLTTTVNWNTYTYGGIFGPIAHAQGGNLMARVVVQGGETKSIAMSNM